MQALGTVAPLLLCPLAMVATRLVPAEAREGDIADDGDCDHYDRVQVHPDHVYHAKSALRLVFIASDFVLDACSEVVDSPDHSIL
jgi:hypothetical protein